MKESIKNFYRNNFVFKGKEKLSKITILFIITMDIFLFIVLDLGINFQIKVLNNPSVSYPSTCRNLANAKDLSNINKHYYSSTKFQSKYTNIKKDQLSIACSQLFTKLDLVKKEHNIKVLRAKEKELLKELSKVTKELNYIRSNYNTSLFENITINSVNINKDIQEKYNNYKNRNEQLKQQKLKLINDFKNSVSVKELEQYIKENKALINKEYKKAYKSYEIKKELITLAFLTPLIFVAFYIMRNFLVKESYLLYIVTKNILVVLLIPTFVSIISLGSTLIPKVFFEKLLRFFYDLNIPFVVYYIAIVILVFVFSYLIIKVQKRYKQQASKFQELSISKLESYNKGICNVCGNSVNYETMNYCPNCQNQLRVNCKACNSKTIKSLKYCTNCSEKL